MDRAIPFSNAGGSGPLLHFAHANAYPPGSYRLFFESLTPHYRVLAIHQRPLWPDSDPATLNGWTQFADDLIAFFEQQGLEDVVGVGHSLGGVATMLAALKRPSLFRALVLVEPVFLPPHILQMSLENPDALALLPLVQSARRRRQQWTSRQDAFERFRSKRVFRRWSDAALWDYVNSGTHLTGDDGETAVGLTYPRDWEARIYSMPPTMVWDAVTQITHPTLAIRAADSDTIYPEPWQLWQQRQPAATFVELPDVGHMLPMEQPARLANLIHTWISQLP